MIEKFPYGKAPFWILVLALVTLVMQLIVGWMRKAEEPDLTMAVFAAQHYRAYLEMLPEFEERHGVRVQLQLVSIRALQSRLQSALLAGTAVPDIVEIVNPSMGYFTRGPLEDVGFLDLTDKVFAEGLHESMVWSRFSIWSSRGRIFALPHDVHPVALGYRRDIVEELGIDVNEIRTWDDFVRIGRQITADLNGDGIIDRYALDMPVAESGYLRMLAQQRGGQYFTEDGQIAFLDDTFVETLMWYARQVAGPNRIGYPAGWGQSLNQAVLQGLVVFYFMPDWRSRLFENDLPSLRGRMALMPLPVWEEGGLRTGTAGGTGLAISRTSQNIELAWELARFLYFDKEKLGEAFALSNILPAVKDAWDAPEFHEPNEYWSGQHLGQIYIELAREAPPEWVTPYSELVNTQMNSVLVNTIRYYEQRGEQGFREFVEGEVTRAARAVQRQMDRNRFYFQDADSSDTALLAP